MIVILRRTGFHGSTPSLTANSHSNFSWFNSEKNSNLLPSLEESLFGLSENLPNNSRLSSKLNYTLLFMRFYIYSCKLHNKALTLSDFANQIEIKYQLEKL